MSKPAFSSWNQGPHDPPYPESSGVSTRDWCAIKLMAAMVSRADSVEHEAEEIIDTAYKMADLMLERRKKV